jgi:signal transduction histidine kinase
LFAKSDFLAKMGHELKNPLNAIIGYSDLLIEDSGETETQKGKDLTSIRSAGFRLLALINALLELSRLEAGKAELRVEELEFSDFFENMVSLSRPSIVASGNKLIVRPSPAGRIVCDSQKLQRVVEGLLSNAAKFTKNGRITFSASMRDDSWSLSIEDTGAGIAQERLASLFETFGSSEDETSSKYANEVRLGLPLAYRYCKLMGGNLSVQSKLGLGSTATVTLPRRSRGVEERTDANMEVQCQAA